MKCEASVKGGGNCILDKEHKGYHSTVGFVCEICSKTYRGQPYRQEQVIIFGEVDDTFSYCFPCVKKHENERELYPYY